MAVDDTRDPLEDATRAIREDESPEWVEVSQSIRHRLRTVVRPAQTATAFDPSGQSEHGRRGSTIQVSERVLTPRLRAVIDSTDRATDSVDIIVTEGRCSSVRIGIVCRYGSDLQAEGTAVRTAVAGVLSEVLGVDPLFSPERDIEITIVDVTEGSPHRQ